MSVDLKKLECLLEIIVDKSDEWCILDAGENENAFTSMRNAFSGGIDCGKILFARQLIATIERFKGN